MMASIYIGIASIFAGTASIMAVMASKCILTASTLLLGSIYIADPVQILGMHCIFSPTIRYLLPGRIDSVYGNWRCFALFERVF